MRRGRLLLLLLLLVGSPSSTHAASIAIQSVNFNGPFDSLAVTRFDQDLGALESVGVTIAGSLTASGVVTQIPLVPSNFVISVQQTFLGGGGGFFDFGSPSTFLMFGSSLDGRFSLSSTFNYTFTFTSLSDIVGFALPSVTGPTVPPITINGRRSDFVGDPALPGFINVAHMGTGLPVSPVLPVVTSISSQGVVIIEYRYTPASNTPSVPEPATTWLLAIGLALAARRRLAASRVP